MRSYTITIVAIFTILISVNEIYSQPCKDFHMMRNCVEPNREFKLYGQSASALLEVDTINVYPVVLYGEKDYIITICTEKGYYPIHFRIVNPKTKRVFYDNMEDDYYESVGFSMDRTNRLNIEITILGKKENEDNFGDTQACVGVNIQWKRTQKLGFR